MASLFSVLEKPRRPAYLPWMQLKLEMLAKPSQLTADPPNADFANLRMTRVTWSSLVQMAARRFEKPWIRAGFWHSSAKPLNPCEPFDSNPWRHLRWKALPIDVNLYRSAGRRRSVLAHSAETFRSQASRFHAPAPVCAFGHYYWQRRNDSGRTRKRSHAFAQTPESQVMFHVQRPEQSGRLGPSPLRWEGHFDEHQYSCAGRRKTAPGHTSASPLETSLFLWWQPHSLAACFVAALGLMKWRS